ncbi:MAG: Ig-like domain-containing protein [Gemmatimonadales bacterium]
MRSPRRMLIAALSACAALAGCSAEHGSAPTAAQTPGPSITTVVWDAWPGIVSSPVLPVGPVGGPSLAAGAHVAYVSAAPGTIEYGARTSVSSRRSKGLTALAFLVDGGFDPVAIAAESGDTLWFSVERTVGPKLTFTAVVRDSLPPVLVRVAPNRDAAEVPLNAHLYVVLSEPCDARVLAPSAIRLLRDGIPVSGGLHFRDSFAYSVEFVPDRPLDAGASYELDVTAALVDRSGRALANPSRDDFTTMVSPVASVLAIESFSAIEYKYDSNLLWWYTPQIRVRETSGRGSVEIVRLEATIPGVGSTGPICSTGMHVGPDSSRSLVNELYGDWEFAMSSASRATAGEATTTIWYRDETGRSASLSASGAVVPGALPTTYTGGRSSMAPGACVFP